VRTTLAIDEDSYQRLQAEMRRRGCSFREVVNESLRRGLDALAQPEPEPRFVVKPVLGAPLPGVNLDSISALLEQLEGPNWR